MAIQKLHLRKLLMLFGLSPQRRLTEIRADARKEVRKRKGGGKSGPDFHTGFWADAKGHAAGHIDLPAATLVRVDENPRSRRRLYPELANGFLEWWNNKRRWINEDISVMPTAVKAPYHFAEIDGIVKVENLLALNVGDSSIRLIYPYFSETPVLSEENARLGLWLMSIALPTYSINNMRILDVLRGVTYSTDRYPLVGNEGAIFVERYARMLADWRRLVAEFEAES
jgi:hypothetical protein